MYAVHRVCEVSMVAITGSFFAFKYCTIFPLFPSLNEPHTLIIKYYLVPRRGIGKTPRRDDGTALRRTDGKHNRECVKRETIKMVYLSVLQKETQKLPVCWNRRKQNLCGSFAEVNIELCRMSSHILIVFLQQHSQRIPTIQPPPSSLSLLW